MRTDFCYHLLYDRLQDTNVQIIRGKKAESFQVCKNEALIKLSGGDTIKADLVVAADGKRSEIAKKPAFLDLDGITGKRL